MTAARKSSVGRSAPRLALLSTLYLRACVCVSVRVCAPGSPAMEEGPRRSDTQLSPVL